jgi:hypothetical protein
MRIMYEEVFNAAASILEAVKKLVITSTTQK